MEPTRKAPDKRILVNLSIKRVPKAIVADLKRRAAAHHRSLQGELLTILEESVRPSGLSIEEIHRRVTALGLSTPDEARRWIRQDRDGR
jgi:plasmid stability protein